MMGNRSMTPGDIYLANFPYGDSPGMKMRTVLDLILSSTVLVLLLGCASGAQETTGGESRGHPDQPKYTNRLAKEKSPYLLQHAHNPVDWYPWGEEAFEKARKE